MTRSTPVLILLAVLALAACGRDPAPVETAPGAPEEPTAATEPGENFERTWIGVLPCADCDGIQTRLLLTRDDSGQTYALEETYLGAEDDAVFNQTGRWVRDGDGERNLFVLDPEAPAGRRFELRPDGALDLLDGKGRPLDTDGQYRLQRL
jgi:copper homeostasis protein (lipoprotein)